MCFIMEFVVIFGIDLVVFELLLCFMEIFVGMVKDEECVLVGEGWDNFLGGVVCFFRGVECSRNCLVNRQIGMMGLVIKVIVCVYWWQFWLQGCFIVFGVFYQFLEVFYFLQWYEYFFGVGVLMQGFGNCYCLVQVVQGVFGFVQVGLGVGVLVEGVGVVFVYFQYLVVQVQGLVLFIQFQSGVGFLGQCFWIVWMQFQDLVVEFDFFFVVGFFGGFELQVVNFVGVFDFFLVFGDGV